MTRRGKRLSPNDKLGSDMLKSSVEVGRAAGAPLLSIIKYQTSPFGRRGRPSVGLSAGLLGSVAPRTPPGNLGCQTEAVRGGATIDCIKRAADGRENNRRTPRNQWWVRGDEQGSCRSSWCNPVVVVLVRPQQRAIPSFRRACRSAARHARLYPHGRSVSRHAWRVGAAPQAAGYLFNPSGRRVLAHVHRVAGPGCAAPAWLRGISPVSGRRAPRFAAVLGAANLAFGHGCAVAGRVGDRDVTDEQDGRVAPIYGQAYQSRSAALSARRRCDARRMGQIGPHVGSWRIVAHLVAAGRGRAHGDGVDPSHAGSRSSRRGSRASATCLAIWGRPVCRGRTGRAGLSAASCVRYGRSGSAYPVGLVRSSCSRRFAGLVAVGPRSYCQSAAGSISDARILGVVGPW